MQAKLIFKSDLNIEPPRDSNKLTQAVIKSEQRVKLLTSVYYLLVSTPSIFVLLEQVINSISGLFDLRNYRLWEEGHIWGYSK